MNGRTISQDDVGFGHSHPVEYGISDCGVWSSKFELRNALAGIGVGVGILIAPLGTWFGRSLFYDVGPFDPLTFVSVAVFLLLVAFAASYVPARRATRVDPVQALRRE